MSNKIFSNIFVKCLHLNVKLFCKNLKSPKHFYLHPLHRSDVKTPYFTKQGDTGKSKINSGWLPKDHIVFEAIGATEELNAFIGLAREFVLEDEKLSPLAGVLRKIQLVLVDVTEIIRYLQPKELPVENLKAPSVLTTAKITAKDIADLETLISHYGSLLPPTEKIIIPGGGKASASLQAAKSVCRRCERVLVKVFKDVDSEKEILAYINRLSSYLCQAARISSKFASRSETIYKPATKSNPQNGTTPDK